MPNFNLSCNAFGRIILTHPLDSTETEVIPVRAFPISDPLQGIALVDLHGHEQIWIDRLDDLPQHFRELIETELATREFMPQIKRIIELSGFITPNTWVVETNRGKTDFVLKGEEAIRRLTPSSIMITDQHGIHFLISDLLKLDRHSRKLLDHFL